MQTYTVSFMQLQRFSHTVTATTEFEAMAEVVKAFYQGELAPDITTLDYFEAEAQP